MRKNTLMVFMLLMSILTFAQHSVTIPLNPTKGKSFNVIENHNDFLLKTNLNELKADQLEIKSGTFYSLEVTGLHKQFGKGQPNIPVFSKLIEVPAENSYKITVTNSTEQIIDLGEYDIKNPIAPAQMSISKSADEKDIQHFYDKEAYATDEFLYNNIYKIEYVGEMRGKHLARIELYPIQYNPVQNQLKVLQDLEINIEFDQDFKTINESNAFSKSISSMSINNPIPANNKALTTEGPIKYVIISDRMFESTLEPFIEWKTKSGFQVIVGYTDDGDVGNTTTSIKAYLQDLYENPPAGEQAPTYVLFVGDLDQVPSFDYTAGSSFHKTDLHYCEYTGDYLPEVLYGRFSAESTAELQPQIDKTLEYEQYAFADNSYLDEVVMVAGVDGSWAPSHGNGQIYYGIQEYFNNDHGITSHTYLYGSGSTITSDDAAAPAAIIANISDGVGFANYTAHCSSDGWADPEFARSDIAGLANASKYPTMIGNCCQSNKFEVDDCFGEMILQAEDKGAIGYIGGTNNTYWDEDFYFGVGLSTLDITSGNADQHDYSNTDIGAYDGMFHENGEPISDWYVTNAQIILCGNLAVESSTSTRKAYYWEIYSLFGDPSLMTYIGVPDAISASYNSNLTVGATSLNVTTDPYAHVTVSENGVQLDSKIADESGSVSLSFEALATPGTDQLDIVITGQNKIPHMEKITVINPSGPYIIVNEVTINDASGNNNGELDFGESVNLVIEFKNVGSENATNVTASITSTDTDIESASQNTSINIGSIAAGATLTVSDKFYFEIAGDIEDQHAFLFSSAITDDSAEDYNSEFSIKANAPSLVYSNFIIDDSGSGNDDGILDAGETAILNIRVANQGSADITNINGTLSNMNGSEAYLTITDAEASLASLPADNANYDLSFTVEGVAGTDLGTPADFAFEATAGTSNQYSVAENATVVIGEIPEFFINEGGTHEVNTGYFYDSGGENGEYGDNEDYTITFVPKTKGIQLVVEFEFFSIEDKASGGCYDYLEIYNGTSTSAELIDSYCDENPPTIITSSNAEGALTFRFYSDGSVTQGGWKASFTKEDLYSVFFTVTNGVDPIEGATIDFNDTEIITDADGEADIFGLENGFLGAYYVDAEGYYQATSTVTVLSDDIYETVVMEAIPTYTATIIVSNGTDFIEGAEVILNAETKETDADGVVVFEGLYELSDFDYTVTADGYIDFEGTVSIENANIAENVTMSPLPKYALTFNISYNEEDFENATITIGDSVKTTDVNGVATFYYYNGSYPFTIEAESFNKVTGTAVIADDVKLVEKSLTKKVYEVELVVSCAENSSRIKDAVYTIDAVEHTTNSLGKIELDMEHGSHTFAGIALGYSDVTEQSIMIDKDTSIAFEMNLVNYTAIFYAIDIDENPIANATITLDGIQYDMNTEGEKSFEMPMGSYTCVIEAEGYNKDSTVVTMDPKDTTYVAVLTLIQFNAIFNVLDEDDNAIEGAVITIESDQKLTDSDGNVSFTLVPGTYTYGVTAEGYESIIGASLTVSTADVTEDVTLVAIPLVTYGINFNVMDLEENPLEGASVTISDNSELTDDLGVASFTEILAGSEIEYIVSLEGYESDTGMISSLNADSTVYIHLVESVGIGTTEFDNLKVYPNPTSGKVFVDGIPAASNLYVFDITGNLILSKEVNEKSLELNLDFVEKGLYIIEVKNHSQHRVFRLVKN